ncbi:M23 family metallopeptidase [Primorskyibacter sp. S87]|uniref:M23 family metallopeptidase n=1 Tax=Primorskyibacter sp. S87 TaxID=3415126 RepID=UPI003C7A4DEE
MRPALLLQSILALAALPAAGEPVLSLPIDCTLGETCHIQNYVDRDPGSGYRDHTCGPLSYDGHKGTDISLLSLRDMKAGVNVLASADGVVRGVRDEMPDQYFTRATAASVEGKECGNGVVIAHDGGWETQYCHMKLGSIQVEQGQTVTRGTVLGEVGLSGRTQFPHIHLSVRYEGQVVDPFATGDVTQCGEGGDILWQEPIDYVPGSLISAGFAPRVPEFAEVQAGETSYASLPSDSPGLVLFGYVFGGRKGDILRIEINGPEGNFAEHDAVLEKDQARLFRAFGRKLKSESWPLGDYRGRVSLIRDGQPISRIETETTIY